MTYSKYLVKDTDQFDPYNFPGITDDLDVIVASMTQAPDLRNSAMLVSFVKDHHMESDWVVANPSQAEMISSKSLPVANLEALFASCVKNPAFRTQLEEYIQSRFKTSAASSVY